MYLFVLISLTNTLLTCDANKNISVDLYNYTQLQMTYGGNLHHAIYDISRGYPSNQLSIVFEFNTDIQFIDQLTKHLLRHDFSISLHNISTVEQQDQYFASLTNTVAKHHDLFTIYFCTQKFAEHILLELYENKLMRRNLVFMFYWGNKDMYRFFVRNLHKTMKVVVITNPRKDAYRLYYNQGTSYKEHNLQMINWWIEGRGLFHHPTLPSALEVFKDFKSRCIYVPVIHKPPWHFVEITNDSVEVHGRDDKLLRLLAEKLNFRYEYVDPPDRIQGTSFNVNGTFDGVLGQIWEKEYEFFIGDVALTQERLRVVEFSFLTLADSGAFITHAPSKLNEALALIRPFHWQVWPAIIFTIILSGPLLYLIIALPNSWYPTFRVKDHFQLLLDCAWYTTGIFLKQTLKPPGDSHKSRFVVILIALSATYVIGDMYAANLTSLLARPGREKPINTLHQLEEAIELRGYRLMVERHSSSYSLLENGTGIYGRLWKLMQSTENANLFLVESVETGVKLVRDASNIAVMAGKETLFFDIQRFGPHHFHLSEKLNTAYSAIALQLGCPYIDNFNKVLMAIFEAGILSKMTNDEYENLQKQTVKVTDAESEPSPLPESVKGNRKTAKANEDNEKLQPISIRMLQGAFYLLGIGYLISGILLALEIAYYRQDRLYKRKKKRFRLFGRFGSACWSGVLNGAFYVKRKFRQVMNEAIISTLEYSE